MRAKQEVVVVPRQHAHIRRRLELEWIAALCAVKDLLKMLPQLWKTLQLHTHNTLEEFSL
jgi:hypothetical protein